VAVKGNNDMKAACKVEKGSWSEEEVKTRSVSGRGMTSNLSGRQGVSMADKGTGDKDCSRK
jgi:hypothetical protein